MWWLVVLGAGTSDLLSAPSALVALTAALAGTLALLLIRRNQERARRLTGATPPVRVRPDAAPHGLVPVPQTPPNAPGRPRPRAPSTR